MSKGTSAWGKVKAVLVKKPVKITCIVLAILVGLFVVVSLLVSPVAKYMIEKHSKEWIGRQVWMDDLDISLIRGRVETTGFHFKEKDDKTDFVKLDTLSVSVNLLKLLAHEVNVRHITLAGPSVRIVQYDSTFNFTDLTELGGDDEKEEEKEDGEPWAIGIYNIRLSDGTLMYRDEVRASQWDLKNLSLAIPGVYFSGKSTDAGISFAFAEGGSLATQAKYDMEKALYNVKVQLKGLALDNFLPYTKDVLNVSSLGGKLDADVHVAGSADDPMDVNVTGKVDVRGIDMKDLEGGKIVSVRGIHADIARINPKDGECTINSVVVDSVDTHFDLYAEGNNFSTLVKESGDTTTVAVENTSSEESKPMVVLIKEIELKNSALQFNDYTLKGEPFRYQLRDIQAKMENFNPDGQENNCDLRLETNGGGNLMMKWKGGMDGLRNQRLTMIVKNVDMKDFTPYMLEYFAYPVKDGRLSMASENVIKEYQLDGRNKLDMYNLRVDDKRKDLKAEYNVPLKTGLYILRDKDDKIQIDLPIEGNVNSPEFSYKRLIIKTLCNLLVKLAVSPMRALASGLGMNPDELSSMPIAASQPGLSSGDYAKLDKLAGVQQSKPEMNLCLVQKINWEEAVKNRSIIEMKRRYYVEQHPELAGQRLSLVDFGKVMDIRDDDAGFEKYLNTASGTDEGSVYDRALRVYPSDSAVGSLNRQFERRNEEIRKYLVGKGIAEEKVKVATMQLEEMKAYKGKDQYAIDMKMEE